MKAAKGCAATNSAAWCGDTAPSTSGTATISIAPSRPRVPNHSAITGPNTVPICWVPRYCTRNRPSSTATEIGITASSKVCEMTFSPSTAESTEMAGVMQPSPKNSAAPTMPSMETSQRPRGVRATRWAKAMRARMPPSPRLSARSTKKTYFTVTVSSSDQMMRDSTPKISPRSTPSAAKCSREARRA